MKNISIILLLFLASFQSFSQTIKGKVADDKGMPIPGANVTNTNGLSSASSDFDGNFIINAKAGDKLKISMIGYTAVTVAASQDMTVKLKEETTTLQDVVVVGYGTRKAIDATMSVAKVKADVLTKQKVLNPVQTVQGKVTGVTIVGNDEPGSSQTIIVRGSNSFTDNSGTPLYVVDGIRMNNINNLNSSNIESFEILKDASALAIYGNESANGVVIITTKKSKGKINVTFDSYFGVRNPLKLVKMASANQYAHYTNLANQSVTISQDQPVNTNWFKEVLQTAQYKNTDLTISGGSENISYSFNANNYNENTIVNGKYNRNTFRFVNEFKFSENTKLNTSINIGFTTITPKNVGALTTAYRQAPIVPTYYENGYYGQSILGVDGFIGMDGTRINNVGNPLSQLYYQNEESRNSNVIGGFNFEQKLFKNFKFQSNFGGEVNYFKSYYFNDILGSATTNIQLPGTNINSLGKTRSNSFKWNFNNLLSYSFKKDNIHDIELMGGFEMISDRGGEWLTGFAYNVPENENYWSIYFSTTTVGNISNGGYYNERHKFSYLGRVNYKLFDRYLLTGNIRRDGSSQFLDGYKWGVFPSVGLGWIISKESFLENSKFVNLLKIRGSWGLLGNENIPLNIQTLSSGTSGYSFGSVPQPFTSNSTEKIKDLSWEETREYSVGFDMDVLSNKLKLSADYYDKLNRNAIFFLDAGSTTGTSNPVPKHAGKISNKGIEFSFNWQDNLNDNLSYRIGANFSHNKNELLEVNKNVIPAPTQGLGNGQDIKFYGPKALGQPVGSFYLYEYAGLDQNGQMLYYTKNGDKVLQNDLSASDKKFFGSSLPTETIGLNLGVTYKQFDLNVNCYAALGSSVYNGKKAQRWSSENIEASVAEDFWTPSNTDASNPAPFNYVPVASTYYLESGDFFRINNINLAYNIPSIDKFITNGQVYLNIINPFISQKFSGFSPEISGSPIYGMGVELGSYPSLRSFTAGIKLNF